MKRFARAISLGLVLAILLTGCGYGGTDILPLPKGMDEKTMTAAGREVLDELLAGEYAEIAGKFRDDIKQDNSITPDSIREMADQYADPDQVGEFVKIKQTAVSGATEKEEHGFVAFECKYTKKTVAIAVAFDPQMNLIGLSIAHD